MKISSKTVLHGLVFLALLANSLATYTPVHAASILYVKQAGNGDCSSWVNACGLQAALATAASGDQIWAMAGTYKPHASDRTVSFVLKSGVAVYGGYTGTGTQRDPDPATNGTILSGDLNDNDNNFTNNGENSYHVVSITNANSLTALDGFTIRSGNANGSSPYNVGGGLFNKGGNPTLTNLILMRNSAVEGGGMWNESSPATVMHVTFSNNLATGNGGGVRNWAADLKLTDVIFLGNSASAWGGGMHSTYGIPALLDVTFDSNSAPYGGGLNINYTNSATLTNITFTNNNGTLGGGLLVQYNSNPTLKNLTFAGNHATSNGGGMANTDNTNSTLTDVKFVGNSAVSHGGGMFIAGNSYPAVTNATFSSNTASGNGGGMYNVNSSPTLTNITFSSNTATYGGGIYTTNGSPPLQNVTLSKNSATNGGGGLYYDVSNVKLRNVIVADSVAGGDCISSGTLGGSYYFNNLIEDPVNTCGLVHGINGNIIGSDPNLDTLADNGGLTQTQALLADSLAIDTGLDANCPSTDQRGVARFGGNHCDMGAYESGFTSNRTISGKAGAANVTLSYVVDGTVKTVTSQLDGSYSLTVSTGWSGTVTPIRQCFTFNPPAKSYSLVLADQTGQDYSIAFNPDSGCSNINVKIGPLPSVGKYLFLPQPTPAILLMRYDNTSNGPVIISNASLKPIIASERVGYQNAQNKWTSFSELMGFPLNLASTRYTFPWYNNKNINTQLRFANVGTSPTTVIVTIGGVLRGSYPLAPSASQRVSYIGLDAGPVVIQSSGGVPIIASERVGYQNAQNKWISFSEMMGLPGQASATYLFPWYNNKLLNSQLRFGNVGTATTTVTVWIGGVPKGSYILAPNQSTRQAYNEDAGPVVIQSSGNVPIIASLRVGYTPDGGTTWPDLSEMMGFPVASLSTIYHFPWYNNADLNTQLRFANVGTSPTTVTVTIGGVLKGSYPLVPNASQRVSYTRLNAGPVVIQSSGGVPIIASERVAYSPDGGTTWTSFSEMMGLPHQQLTNAYVFPWYNNVDLNTQLRFGVP